MLGKNRFTLTFAKKTNVNPIFLYFVNTLSTTNNGDISFCLSFSKLCAIRVNETCVKRKLEIVCKFKIGKVCPGSTA